MTLPAHWWKERAQWLDGLYAATAGETGGEAERKGFIWLSEHESRDMAARLRQDLDGDASTLAGWIHEDAHEACRAALARAVPLAHRGELCADRWARKLQSPMLFGDPARPEQIWLALDGTMPPPLWIPAGTTAASLAEAFAPYAHPELDAPLPSVLAMPHRICVFIGTEQGFGADFDQLAGFVQSLPGTDSLPWGSRFMDDPWPARPTGIALIAAGHQMPEKTAQLDGAVPTMTVRSRRLGAAITVAALGHFYTLRIHYTPVAHASVVGALRQIMPGRTAGLPLDMPVDALSVLARFGGMQAAEALAAMRDPAEQDNLGFFAMATLAALGDDGASVRALLRELIARPSPAERGLGYELASLARQTRILHEALLHETDPENRAALAKHLQP
jgi:hypothetical protein